MRSQLQDKLLEMMKWLDAFFAEHNLSYYMVGGTMLGAVRHEGFIPWDDDIDIAMPREDYEKAIELLKEPVDHYVIEGPMSPNKDFVYAWAKFYDLNTTMTENVKKPIRRGVFIDIFPLDGIGNSMEESLKNYKRLDRLNLLLAMKTCKHRKQRVWWKNVAVFIGNFLPLSPKKLAMEIDTLSRSRSFEDSFYIASTMTVSRAKEIVKKTVYGAPKKYKFEDTYFYGLENAEEYLKIKYDDWKVLPPAESRETAHDFIELDLEHGWTRQDKNK